MDKATLRSEIRRLKRTFPREQLDTWSQTITRALLDDGRIGAARRVLLYHPLPDEVDTTALIARLQATHDIILPVVVGDDLVIEGVETLSGGVVDAAGDHRIAMMAAVLATRCSGPTTIVGAECVSKSYPAFFEDLSSLGGICEKEA